MTNGNNKYVSLPEENNVPLLFFHLVPKVQYLSYTLLNDAHAEHDTMLCKLSLFTLKPDFKREHDL